MCDVIDESGPGGEQTARLQAFLDKLTDAAGVPRASGLCVRIVGASEMRELNLRYRGVAEPTDVLSFPAGGGEFPMPEDVLGDIVVCLPEIGRNSADLGHSLETELFWAVTHGLLHILGWDHDSPESLNAMEKRTMELIEKCGLEVALSG